MALHPPTRPKPRKVFSNTRGKLYLGRCEDVLSLKTVKRLKGKVQLIFTSPPFPLNKKKRYGNHQGEAYLKWLSEFGPVFNEMLTDDGSVVMEIGNAWEPGSPVQSTLPYEALLGFLNGGGFKLCQEITYYNPARLPSPAQWVTIERCRLKDATTKIWWMSKTAKPKADNRNVLKPYSKEMLQLLKRKTYNAGTRPSEHIINETSFLKNNKGAIAPNLIIEPNTQWVSDYQNFCKANDIQPHPARMPIKIPEFFIKFLTDPGDLVMDPFAGSNTTGEAANQLKRKWLSIEAIPTYAAASVSRFNAKKAEKLLEQLK